MKTFAFLIALLFARASAAEPAPRATSGDDRAEPAWKEKLTVEVGITHGDMQGNSDKAIQAAVDYVARLGGGTVEILPGTYRFRNSVFLASRVRLAGHGKETVLVKEASSASPLTEDSDWYDQEITLKDAKGFQIGDGICLRAKSSEMAIKRTLVARDGARFKLDRALRSNVWIAGGKDGAMAETLFPLLSGENIEDVVIENLTLDGNREHNALLDGNYAGCIWLQDCRRITMRGLEARNYHGDGLSWQICHDVLVENCYSHGHSGLGLHPGSGSQRSLIRRCNLEANDIGIFFCWGVRGGIAQENTITGNRLGISIGHHDTDNIVRGNTITGSTQAGILFRAEKDAAAAGHRNLIENNTLTDNGGEDGAAIKFDAPACGVIITGNTLKETRAPSKRTGISICQGVEDAKIENNIVEGFAKDVSPAQK
jgi:parallel beta-helix repeat protein